MTAVFDEVGANSKKIAVTKSDGTTQLYVEIEEWDSVNEKAWLHVSRSGWTISSTADTDIYLYYDNSQPDNTTYVGDPSDAVVHNVWDTNFIGVWHLKDTAESTSNNKPMTAYNSPAQVDGKINGAYDLESGSSQYLDRAADDSLYDVSNLSALTIEAWIKAESWTNYGLIIGKSKEASRGHYLADYGNTGKIYWAIFNAAHSDYIARYTSALSTGTWYHIVMTWDGGLDLANSPIKIYANNTQIDTDDIGTSIADKADSTAYLAFGYFDSGTYWDGIIDEVRISNSARTAAWIKASYESGRDDLISYGSQEIYEPLTDAFSLADIISLLKSRTLSLADAYTLADAITTQLVPGAKIISLADAFAHSDAFSTQEVYYRALLDTHNFAEVLGTQEVYYRTLRDDYSLADVTSVQEVFNRVLLDGYDLADPTTVLRTRLLTIMDPFTHADPFTKLLARRLTLEDNYDLADVLSRQEVYYRTLEDALAYADILSKLEAYYLTLTDAFIHLSVARAPDLDISRGVAFVPKTIAEQLEGLVPVSKTIAQYLERLLNP